MLYLMQTSTTALISIINIHCQRNDSNKQKA